MELVPDFGASFPLLLGDKMFYRVQPGAVAAER